MLQIQRYHFALYFVDDTKFRVNSPHLPPKADYVVNHAMNYWESIQYYRDLVNMVKFVYN